MEPVHQNAAKQQISHYRDAGPRVPPTAGQKAAAGGSGPPIGRLPRFIAASPSAPRRRLSAMRPGLLLLALAPWVCSCDSGTANGMGALPAAHPTPTAAARAAPLAPLPRVPARLEGELASVQDGDSFRLRLPAGGEIRVRIGGIDAPELGQPYADDARDHLRLLMGADRLVIDAYKTDPFGRYVATVYARGHDLGLAQVADGMAWHFIRYSREQTPEQRRDYAAAEQRARSRAIGLWAGPQPLAPWSYRRAHARRTDH